MQLMVSFIHGGRARLLQLAALALLAMTAGAAAQPLVIGLNADMSSASSRSGAAIERGALIAIDEINGRGGIGGRKLELKVRDHRGNPARAIDDIDALAAEPGLVAILGGLHSIVILNQITAIHEREIPYLVPWAAATELVANGRQPNYVFRVSVNDAAVGRFLVSKAVERGLGRVGLMLERTAWGRSNEVAMVAALEALGQRPAATRMFAVGTQDMTAMVESLAASGAQAVVMAANAREGAAVVRAMAALPPARRLPIIAHWGITGGGFFEAVGDELRGIDLTFVQTFSFLAPRSPEIAQRVLAACARLFADCRDADAIAAPVGVAHGYDLVTILGRAIERAGSSERPAIRAALEQLDQVPGLARAYAPPFTPDRHEGLEMSDYFLARYDEKGRIVPLGR